MPRFTFIRTFCLNSLQDGVTLQWKLFTSCPSLYLPFAKRLRTRPQPFLLSLDLKIQLDFFLIMIRLSVQMRWIRTLLMTKSVIIGVFWQYRSSEDIFLITQTRFRLLLVIYRSPVRLKSQSSGLTFWQPFVYLEFFSFDWQARSPKQKVKVKKENLDRLFTLLRDLSSPTYLNFWLKLFFFAMCAHPLYLLC